MYNIGQAYISRSEAETLVKKKKLDTCNSHKFAIDRATISFFVS